MMVAVKKFNTKLILVLFILLGVVGGVTFYFSSKDQDDSGNASQLGRVERRDLIQRITIAGKIFPKRKTIITAPFQGYLKKVYVQVGQAVKAGDPLVSVVQSLVSTSEIFPMRAPFAGKVVYIGKAEGEFVRELDFNDYIMRIDDMEKLYVQSFVPEIDRIKLKVGLETIIKISPILDRSYKGRIEEMSLSALDQSSSRSQVEFPIKIIMLERDERVRSGMSAIIDVVVDKREKVLTLKHQYIHRDEEKNQYYVILNSGQRKNIEVGLQNEESFEILKGVEEGEWVQPVDYLDKVDQDAA